MKNDNIILGVTKLQFTTWVLSEPVFARFATSSVTSILLKELVNIHAIEFVPKIVSLNTPTETRNLNHFSGLLSFKRTGEIVRLAKSNGYTFYISDFNPIIKFDTPIVCDEIIPPTTIDGSFDTITATALAYFMGMIRYWYSAIN